MNNRKLQFRIRSLLIAAVAFSALFALIAAWRLRAQKQAHLVGKQREIGAAVGYSIQPESVTAKAAEAIGIDMVASPKELFVNSLPNEPVDIQGIVAIKSLEHLAFCATGLVDQDLEHLKQLPDLKHLNLSSTSVTDRGIDALTSLGLVSLHLEDTAVSDDAIESLMEINTLKYLCLSDGALSESSLQRLTRKLPMCKVKLVKPSNPGLRAYVADQGPAE